MSLHELPQIVIQRYRKLLANKSVLKRGKLFKFCK